MNNRVYRTEEDSINAIEEDPRNIGRVSYIVLNRKMCELAVRKDGCTISLIPELLIDPDLCILAIKNGAPINYLPYNCLNLEICTLAIELGQRAIYAPRHIKTKEFWKMSVKVNYLNFRDIPSKYKDFNMCEEVMDKDPTFIDCIPMQYMNLSMCKTARQLYGEEEEFVPSYILTIQDVEAAYREESKSGLLD
jgi:hypothetical protein